MVQHDRPDDASDTSACDDAAHREGPSFPEVLRSDGEGWEENDAHACPDADTLREEGLVVVVGFGEGEHECAGNATEDIERRKDGK